MVRPMKLLAQRKTMTLTSMAYAHDAAHLFLRKKATGMASDQPEFDFDRDGVAKYFPCFARK
jgi:hypothetical protein